MNKINFNKKFIKKKYPSNPSKFIIIIIKSNFNLSKNKEIKKFPLFFHTQNIKPSQFQFPIPIIKKIKNK